MDKLAASGAIDNDTRLGGPTVSDTVAAIDSKEAVRVVVPWLTPNACPDPLTVATVVAVEDQPTNVVTFCVLPSL